MMLLLGCSMVLLALVLFAVVVAFGLQWWPSLIITPFALVALAR